MPTQQTNLTSETGRDATAALGGALSEKDAVAAGLTSAELQTRSFQAILERRA